MTGLKKKIKVGNLLLPNNIFYAPLAGFSDFPFRKMSRLFHSGLIFCEMVSIEALIRQNQNTFNMLDYSDDMHPIGAQVYGNNPKAAAQSAKIIENLGFDLIDLNCGCPVKKVTRKESGSGMLKNIEMIGDVLSAMVSSVKIPVTVKIRIGWDESTICANEITRIAEQAGAKVITIHGRTRSQSYKDKADWSFIKEAKLIAKSIKVFGNGDILKAEGASQMFCETNCDGILIARGIMGQPWIASDVNKLVDKEPVFEKTNFFIYENMMKHFSFIVDYKSEKNSLISMKKIGHWYLKRCKKTKPLKIALNDAKSPTDIFKIMDNFSWKE
jgi:nifR3 family TIM-barrel protein